MKLKLGSRCPDWSGHAGRSRSTCISENGPRRTLSGLQFSGGRWLRRPRRVAMPTAAPPCNSISIVSLESQIMEVQEKIKAAVMSMSESMPPRL